MSHGRRSARLLALIILGMAIAPAAAAQAAPEILQTVLPGPTAGMPVDLTVSARDSQAPITGMIVGFGNGQGGFGLSACTEGPSGSVMPANTAVTMVVPHAFSRTGPGTAGLHLLSNGCANPASTASQQIGYTVVKQGQKPVPSTYSVPVIGRVGPATPLLPGLGSIPIPVVKSPAARTPLRLHARALRTRRSVAAACPGSGAPAAVDPAGLAKTRKALLCLMNAERSRRGLRRVRMNSRLAKAATRHSQLMFHKRFFAHVGPGSLSLRQRLAQVRYLPKRGGWLIGENLAFGSGRNSSPLAIHRAWMKSTEHRANILNRTFREAGFGVVKQAPFGKGATFTTDFGWRQ